ncbi:MAG: PDZ domain-containing protein, partial [Planctomycetota bacterium]
AAAHWSIPVAIPLPEVVTLRVPRRATYVADLQLPADASTASAHVSLKLEGAAPWCDARLDDSHDPPMEFRDWVGQLRTSWCVTGLVPGHYRLQIRLDCDAQLLEDEFDVRPGDSLHHTLRAEPGASIRGRVVLPDGTPVGQLRVWSYRGRRCKTDDGGHFEVGGLTPGPCRVIFDDEGHAPGGRTIQLAHDDRATWTGELPPAGLDLGTWVRTPLVRVTLQVEPPEARDVRLLLAESDEAEAKLYMKHGPANFILLAPGRWRVEVRDDEWRLPAVTHVVVPLAGLEATIRLEQRPADDPPARLFEVRGVVVWHGGAPVDRDAKVQLMVVEDSLTGDDRGGAGLNEVASARLDDESKGAFRLTAAAGTYLLEVSAELDGTTVRRRQLLYLTSDMTVEPIRIGGSATVRGCRAGAWPSDCECRVVARRVDSSEPGVVETMTSWTSGPRFWFDRMPAGHWQLSWWERRTGDNVGEFDVPPAARRVDAADTALMPFAQGGDLAVRVVDSSGRGVHGLKAFLVAKGGWPPLDERDVETSHDGSATMPGRWIGRECVLVVEADYGAVGPVVRVPPSDAPVQILPDVVFVPRKGQRVVTVLDGGPAAVAGIRPLDIVVQYAGEAIADRGDLSAAIYNAKRRLPAGTVVPIVVERDGVQLTLHVRVGPLGVSTR